MQELDSKEKSRIVTLRQEHESNSNTKLDWMYGNPTQNVDTEDYLLGRAIDPTKNHVEHECIPPSLRDLHSTDHDQVDIARKLQEDPLLEIHRREVEARKQMLQNPIKLKQLQQQLLLRQAQEESSSDDDLDKRLLEKYMKLKNLTSSSNKSKRKKSKKRKSEDSERSKHKSKKHKKSRDEVDSSVDVRKRKKRSVSCEKIGPIKENSHRRHEKDTSHKRSRSYSRERRGADSDNKLRRKDRRDENRHQTKEKVKHARSKSPQIHRQNLGGTPPPRQPRPVPESPDSSPTRKPNYGLVTADGEKILQIKSDVVMKTSAKTSTSKKWVKPEKVRLSEKEKERRRQEMLENVQWKEKINAKDAQQPEVEENHANYQENPQFINKYLQKSTNLASIETRIRSNMNNIQRRDMDMHKNFARR